MNFRARRTVGTATVAALLLAACGSDNESNEDSGAAALNTASATAAPADTTAETIAPTTAQTTGATTATPDTPAPTAPAVDVVGVTDDTIRISMVAPFSGVYKDIIESVVRNGAQVRVDEVNASGGVHGRMIELVKIDNFNTPEGGVSACEEAQNNDTFVPFGYVGFEPSVTGVPCLDEAGIPAIVQDLPPEGSEHSYAYKQNDESYAEVYAQLIAERFPDQAVGIVYVSQSTYEAAKDHAVAALEEAGITVAGAEAIEAGAAAVIPQLTRLKDAGTEVLLMMVTVEMISLYGGLVQMGWAPQVITGAQGTVDGFMQAVGEPAAGSLGVHWWAGSDVPEFAEYVAVAEQTGAPGPFDSDAFSYYAMASILVAALEAAGPDLNHATFEAGIQSLQGVQVPGYAPVTFSADKHWGPDQAWVMECCQPNGAYRTVGLLGDD
jgi:branched-chain amino acid transport system substrate-binding protein